MTTIRHTTLAGVALALAIAIGGCGADDDAGDPAVIDRSPAGDLVTAASGPPTETTEPAAPSTEPTDPGVLPTSSPTSSLAPAPTPTPTTPLSDAAVVLREVAWAEQPLDLATREGDPSIYIAEKTGRVWRYIPGDTTPMDSDPEPTLDLSSEVSTDGERGLLGVAFGPDGRLYTSYTDHAGDSIISSWDVADRADGGVTIDPASETVHLTLEQPYSNHNGGDIAFGPDDHLYIGFGDGGSANDPLGAGQDPTTLLGSIVRILPTPDGYDVSPDNPFVGLAGVREELYVIGLRNPWRFSFDGADLWIGDVGQGSEEEIDHLPAGTAGGANLGWNRREGSLLFDENTVIAPAAPTLTEPLVTYGRDDGVSVTGGVVVRDPAIPALDGTYLYADFGRTWVRGLRLDEDGRIAEHQELFEGVGGVAGFGTGPDGEVYVLTLGGPIYVLEAGGR